MLGSHRVRETATGLAAAFALLAIVAGVPIVLVRAIGWPLPASVPRLDAIGTALRYGQIAPSTLLKMLAVIVWVTWVLMTAGILVELLALARGTVARTLPTIGGLQQVAARLLTATMLLSTLTTRPAAAVTAVAPAAMVTPVSEPTPAREASVDREQNDAPAWVVRRHDSLWAIAERTLGDGHRWREIRDLNVGRRQPGGGTLRADDTMIHPGWVLRLPDDATAGRPPERQVEVQRGDHLWGLAETHLGDGARWRQVYTRNAGAPQPGGGRLTQPDVIRPGWVLTLPGRRAPRHDGEPTDRHGHNTSQAARETPVAPLPVTPSTLPHPPDPAEPDRPAPPDHPARASASVSEGMTESAVVAASTSKPRPQRDVVPIAGIALLAAGLVGVLAHRRRTWLRRRRAGSALEPIDPEAAELERWLRAMADHDLSHRIDRVLRLLSEHFAQHGVDPPVLALELGERVGLLLATADTSPPPGITASDDGCMWTLDAEFEVAAPPDDVHAPLAPALVGCGRRPTGEVVALNLLHAGVLDIAGPMRDVENALMSWTAELASSGAAAGVELIVVGGHHHLIEEFARVTIAEDAPAAVSRLDRLLGPSSGRGASGGREPTSHAVVLSAEPATGDAWGMLRRRAGEDPRVALVMTGDHAAEHRLVIDGDRVRLDPPGLELAAPEWLTPQTWDRYGDLLRQPVRQRPSEQVPSPLVTAPLDRRLAHRATLDASDDTEPARLIRVLGPLDTDGITVPSLVADVLAFLAVHGEGVSVDTLHTQVGPGGDVRAAVDAALAPGADDRPLITVDSDGCYRLADGVGSDIGRFRALTRQLDHQTPATQTSRMQAALALVRGLPFAGCGGWVHAAGLVTATTALICDIAHRLATLIMTFGDLDRATWAVSQGLLASPGCELLYRDRMRIADAHGDHVALDAIMHDLRTRAGTDDGWVTPETLQLYEQLKRSSTITAAPTDVRDAS